MTKRFFYALHLPLVALCAGSLLANDQDAKPASKDTEQAQKSEGRKLPRVRFGGLMVGVGYSYYSGRYPYYGYGPYGFAPWGWGYYPYYSGFYDPWFYGPYIHPGYFAGFGYQPNMGEVKLQSAERGSWVYINGALAGKAERLKTIYLEPGAYDLQVRSGDRKFDQRIYVLSGKTLKIAADMEHKEQRP